MKHREMVLRDSIMVHAPIERCFVLSTCIELVQRTLGFLPEPMTGYVSANSRVVWRGRMFGLVHTHHTLITAFDPPNFFQDTQEHGRFASFHHDHSFRTTEAGTVMEDAVHFALPWWLGSSVVARFVMAPQIRRLMQARFHLLKELAEGEGWRDFVESSPAPPSI